MFISSITYSKNLYSITPMNSKTSNKLSKPEKDITTEQPNFRGIEKAEVAKNQMRILVAQDIWAPRLKVKLPESQLEKEALLEVLEQRLKLDKYVRLKNDRLAIFAKLDEIDELSVENPKSPKVLALKNELAKRGNIDAVLLTINRQLEQEEKRNKSAFDYFENLDKTMEEYLDKKLIKYNQIEKFWHQVRKNDINAEGKLNTSELIETLKSPEKIEASSAKPVSKILSRKEFLAQIEKEYEQLLRENINVYATAKENKEVNSQYKESRNVRYQIMQKHANAIKNLPGITDTIRSTFSKIEKMYAYKVHKITGVNIYPIGEIWDQMRPVEKSLLSLTKEISELKTKLLEDQGNKELEKELLLKEKMLEEAKTDWLTGAKLVVNYEATNYSRMEEAGKLNEYIYLTAENKRLNLNKEIVQILTENEGTIPEEYWDKIIESSKSWN